MIKAIIFDFDGVITYEGRFNHFTKQKTKQFNISPEVLHQIIRKYWKPASLGETNSDEFWNEIAKEVGCEKQEIRSLLMEYMYINEKMVDYIKLLKEKYKIALLSNHIADWIEEKLNVIGLNEIFDEKIVSYNVKLRKPDHRIYKLAAKKLELKEEECIFVDDKQGNVNAANEVGMKGILFTNLGSLKVKIDKELL